METSRIDGSVINAVSERIFSDIARVDDSRSEGLNRTLSRSGLGILMVEIVIG